MELSKAELVKLKEDAEVANVEVRLYSNGNADPILLARVDFKQFPGLTLMYFFDAQDMVWKLLKM